MTSESAERVSPVRKALQTSALAGAGGPVPLPPLDPANLPIHVMFWRVLIEPVAPKQTFGDSQIVLPDVTQDAQRILTTVGRVIELGSFAFVSKTAAGLNLADERYKPKVGDYVLYEQYAGQEIRLSSGHLLRVLNDTEILCWAKDAETIKGYV